ncbi:hypothetical protein V6N11_069305 [Hibiscus sabdariffa]|uniref:Uncharacterized protein n=1 Tax=Hibiscus sabdariffa TaxID=183260 RepID=A0ABR1ZYU1_9ROSI
MFLGVGGDGTRLESEEDLSSSDPEQEGLDIQSSNQKRFPSSNRFLGSFRAGLIKPSIEDSLAASPGIADVILSIRSLGIIDDELVIQSKG